MVKTKFFVISLIICWAAMMTLIIVGSRQNSTLVDKYEKCINDINDISCPVEKGYGIQSQYALCAEVIYGVCKAAERCEKGPAIRCIRGGMLLCGKIPYNTEFDLFSSLRVYEDCLPKLETLLCEELDENFPQSCNAIEQPPKENVTPDGDEL